MEPLGASLLSERIREFLHLLHAYHFQSDLVEIIRVVEKPGWVSEIEISRMIETADMLCTHIGAIRTLTKNLIEDSRAVERRAYSVADPASHDSQGVGEPPVDQE